MCRLITILTWIILLSACTSTVARKNLPYPLTNDTFGEEVKVVTVPLPIIASNPNEGITTGALSAFLLHDKKDEVSTLVSAQVNYNENFGVTPALYAAFYPAPEQRWQINLSKSSNVNEEYRLRYINREFTSDKLELNLYAAVFTDGSARFYGFQSTAREQDQTNYADQEMGLNLSLGYRFSNRLKLVCGERLAKVNIKRGAVARLPFITDLFPASAVPGVNGFNVNAQKLSLVYSTLDSQDLPTSGIEAWVSMENNSTALGSSADYEGFEADFKEYIPHEDAKYISVLRLACKQTTGRGIPFLERASLGGETTLRGYGLNRFIDNGYMLLNLEERIRLVRWRLFNVLADWEVAPFIDFGSVFAALDRANTASFEFNPGIGIRAVVRPNIVGRIDVGFGREGPAVFVGLGYPF